MNNDVFFYDTERLGQIASEPVIQKGLAYFNENRVIDLQVTEYSVSALVEGSDPDQPYSVELTTTEDQTLRCQCQCSFRREPVCKHAVAVLYSYAAETVENETFGSALDEAIKERVRKGKNEVRVTQLADTSAYGAWQAASIQSTTHWQQTYQVQIRSLQQRINYCTCPDWAINQLGTCKHIEATLHQISKQADYDQLKEQGPPFSFIYLQWDSATEARIRLHKADGLDSALDQLLNTFFDASGAFSGRLPEDFFRLCEQLRGRNDLQIGEDAQQFAQRYSEDAAQQLRAQTISREIIHSGSVPGVRARLFPYQIEGVAFLASRGRALLADDMGLGKTLQSIAAAAWLAENAGVKRVLVVCPASLKHQWAREIEKFTAYSAQVIQGGPESRQVQYRTDKLFVIVNYELILRDFTVVNDSLKPDLIILDEAQRIKNWRTKIASTIKLIPSRYAFVLTGTPLENRLEDLYSLLQLVDPRVLGPLWRCMIDFHITDERGKVLGYRNLSELRRRIAPVMLRRDRSLVNDQLPERTETQLDIPMTAVQLGLHDEALATAGRLATIAKRRPLTPSESNRMMAALQQARMACNAAGLVDKETLGAPKLDELERLFEEICLNSARKVVVFSQWERMTFMVEELTRKMKIGSVRLHGGVPSHKRGDLIDRFAGDEAIQVFISTDAGGTGLNLQSATVLVNLDMPWNPAILDQRIARIHRLGQKQKVQVFLLMAQNSYEARVAGLVKGKRNLFDNVIRPDASKDVVGVSKQMLETLIDDLTVDSATSTPAQSEVTSPQLSDEETGLAPLPPEVDETEMAEALAARSAADAEVHLAITRIQAHFTDRIERILGSGGGLLVIMNRVEDEDEAAIEALATDVPVALLESRALQGLQRLGAASPVADSPLLYEPPADAAMPRNPFLQQAENTLRSAEVLLEQGCTAGVLELLSSTMLCAAAGLNNESQLPTMDEAAVWIYGTALPKGILTQDQANALSRAIALSRASDIPDELIYQVLEDARQLNASISHS